MLGPDDVGHRVVVRRVVGRRDGRALFSDALGVLRRCDDVELVVDTARGPVSVARAAVVAAKRVPAQPVTRRAITAVELAANQAWPAIEQEPLGQWLLRAADGWSMRANSALCLGDPGMPLPAAIDRVRRWYADRGLPPRAIAPLPLARRADAALAARGWHAESPMLVQTADLAHVRQRASGAPGPADPVTVTLTDSATPQWLAFAANPDGYRPAQQLPAAAVEVLTGGGRLAVRFAHVHDSTGRLVAAGRGTVTGEGQRWLGLSRMLVDPAVRRQGLARRLVAELATWADSLGATGAFLQVEADNTGAQSLYERLGFTPHHRCVARTAPPDDGG